MAIAVRSSSGTKVSVRRVSTTSMPPSAARIFSTRSATSSTTAASVVFDPEAPGSLPPWPGSMTMRDTPSPSCRAIENPPAPFSAGAPGTIGGGASGAGTTGAGAGARRAVRPAGATYAARSIPGGRPRGGRIAARTISGWVRRARNSPGGLETARVGSAGAASTAPRRWPGESGVSSTARSGSTTTIRVGGATGRTTAGAATRFARSNAGGGGAGAGIDAGSDTVVGTSPVRGTATGIRVTGGVETGAVAAGGAADASVPAGRPDAGCRSIVSRNGW